MRNVALLQKYNLILEISEKNVTYIKKYKYICQNN